jgi:chromate transporter
MSNSSEPARKTSALTVLFVFLKLGLTSFGGPVAHLGYFRREFVERRRWLDDEQFTALIGLCQILPGPASSQVGFSVGLMRAGWSGGLAAWLGFTLPSVAAMILFAAAVPSMKGLSTTGALHGLKLVAVAIVAQAVFDMTRRLCPDRRRAAIAVAALVAACTLPPTVAQPAIVGMGALCGAIARPVAHALKLEPSLGSAFPTRVSRSGGVLCLISYFVLLAGLPALAQWHPGGGVTIFAAFYRAGALVFGGGHVVLPLLQQQTVGAGWITPSSFLAGYGAAQAVPGPLFTFAAYAGWVTAIPNPGACALIATAGIFVPGLLLVTGVLPYWQWLRTHPKAISMLEGINAAVVGLLAAALYSPVWISAVFSAVDFSAVAFTFILLTRWKAPPLMVVLICLAAGIVEAHALA